MSFSDGSELKHNNHRDLDLNFISMLKFLKQRLCLVVNLCLWLSLDCTEKWNSLCLAFFLGPVYYSQDLQVQISANVKLKVDFTTLFTHLKIILLQCFQFLVFNNKRYSNRPYMCVYRCKVLVLFVWTKMTSAMIVWLNLNVLGY